MKKLVSIQDFNGWASTPVVGLSSCRKIDFAEQPDAQAIPPMLRRRLNSIGRACASKILSMVEHGAPTPIVYASRHGDINRTLSVLQDLAAGEAVSPIDFSLAVHNAICGVASIHHKLTGNVISIATKDGLSSALIESIGLLAEGNEQVLCIVADPLLPEIYQTGDTAPETSYACAFVVTATGGVELSIAPSTKPHIKDAYEALHFIQFMSGDQTTFAMSQNGCRWDVSKET